MKVLDVLVLKCARVMYYLFLYLTITLQEHLKLFILMFGVQHPRIHCLEPNIMLSLLIILLVIYEFILGNTNMKSFLSFASFKLLLWINFLPIVNFQCDGGMSSVRRNSLSFCMIMRLVAGYLAHIHLNKMVLHKENIAIL
jgi:hypothetical protein